MYYGKMTDELRALYAEYEKKWGHDPDGYDNVEYDNSNYSEYVYYIKWALRVGKELTDLYPPVDGEW